MISSSTWRPQKLTNSAKGMSEANLSCQQTAGLFVDDGYFGGGDFETDEFVARVEVEMNFEAGRGGF